MKEKDDVKGKNVKLPLEHLVIHLISFPVKNVSPSQLPSTTFKITVIFIHLICYFMNTINQKPSRQINLENHFFELEMAFFKLNCLDTKVYSSFSS